MHHLTSWLLLCSPSRSVRVNIFQETCTFLTGARTRKNPIRSPAFGGELSVNSLCTGRVAQLSQRALYLSPRGRRPPTPVLPPSLPSSEPLPRASPGPLPEEHVDPALLVVPRRHRERGPHTGPLRNAPAAAVAEVDEPLPIRHGLFFLFVISVKSLFFSRAGVMVSVVARLVVVAVGLVGCPQTGQLQSSRLISARKTRRNN